MLYRFYIELSITLSVKFLTNQAGQITDSYQYDAYGEITNKTGNTDNIYLYTGEQFDRSLNQYYLRARYYNQGVGRFTQMDSWHGKVSDPTTLNKYLYANGAPILYTDPSGHFGLASFGSSFSVMSTLNSIAIPSSAAFLAKASVGLLTAGVITHTAIDSDSTIARILRSGIAQQALKIERGIQKERIKRRANGKPIKFYYSSRLRIISISSKGGTLATPKYSGHLGNGVPKPPGFYGTDIQPWDKTYTQESLSALFYGGDKKRDVSWFLAFDGTTCIPVYSTPHECYIPSALGMNVPVQTITIGPNHMEPY
ncbi:Rhs family protein [Psychrobacter aquaticus CMS 56]|uniref:Rhs family protein n=1 Tax=Psychrobacter aquaticus CMS 56 TaxID=1354303 RepID=U4T3N3_9GAMM|nr:Rhs family protein [Psychrobacter aquaticus CMS 56]